MSDKELFRIFMKALHAAGTDAGKTDEPCPTDLEFDVIFEEDSTLQCYAGGLRAVFELGRSSK